MSSHLDIGQGSRRGVDKLYVENWDTRYLGERIHELSYNNNGIRYIVAIAAGSTIDFHFSFPVKFIRATFIQTAAVQLLCRLEKLFHYQPGTELWERVRDIEAIKTVLTMEFGELCVYPGDTFRWYFERASNGNVYVLFVIQVMQHETGGLP